MALKISQTKNAFRCKVIISEPVDNGFEDQTVYVRFKVVPQSRIDEVVRNENDDDKDILDEVLTGWDESAFRDDAESPILFTPENKTLILDVPYVRTALIKAYFQALNGKDYKRKN